MSWGHCGCALATGYVAARTAGIRGSVASAAALGSWRAVTSQGSSNTVIADNVVNDIAVYGWGQAVVYKSGDPSVVNRGRELGMTNRIDRVPAREP